MRALQRIVDAIFGLWQRTLDEAPEGPVLRLTLLLLILHGSEGENFQFLLRVIAAPMLLSTSLTANRWLWLVLAAVCSASTYTFWFGQDNHKFLTAYWTIACCLAVWNLNPARILAVNGRLLVALVFSFAVFWKIFGGELLNGKFFEFAFLSDPRFELMGRLGGLSSDVLSASTAWCAYSVRCPPRA
ncbi:MAG: hypothetical protein R2724_29660 [Bryobacterales bacterium]